MYRHDRVVCPTDTGQAARVSVAMADAPATPKHYPDYILRPHFGYVLDAMVQFSTAPCATHHPHCLRSLSRGLAQSLWPGHVATPRAR